jgi:hypothetical protein
MKSMQLFSSYWYRGKSYHLFLTVAILSILLHSLSLSALSKPQLCRLHYDGGGDWYNDPDALPNLVDFVNRNIGTDFSPVQAVVKLTDTQLFDYPFLMMTGHGNIGFSEQDIRQLRNYLSNGGFLYADDDYGMDPAFRREIRKVFPDRELVELPPNHELFHSFYTFPEGIPKIHEHDGERPQAFAIFNDYGRIMVLYTYETNVSDGWSDAHDNPPDIADQAFKLGANIIHYLITR